VQPLSPSHHHRRGQIVDVEVLRRRVIRRGHIGGGIERFGEPTRTAVVDHRGGPETTDGGLGVIRRELRGQPLHLGELHGVGQVGMGAQRRLFRERNRVVGPRSVHRRRRQEQHPVDPELIGRVEHPASHGHVDGRVDLGTLQIRAERRGEVDHGRGAVERRHEVGIHQIEVAHASPGPQVDRDHLVDVEPLLELGSYPGAEQPEAPVTTTRSIP
jgi:hypothetical protein